MHRYWLWFDPAAAVAAGWPVTAGVTGRSVEDCLDILRRWFGPRTPPLTETIEDPDLTTFQPGDLFGGWPLGVPVWRGIWYPPLNLAGPEPRPGNSRQGIAGKHPGR